jgi:hypothetical protein
MRANMALRNSAAVTVAWLAVGAAPKTASGAKQG